MRWLKSLFRRPVQFRLIDRHITNMTLAEWRADKKLCANAHALIHNTDMQVMLCILKNMHPAWSVLNLEMNPNARVIWQGRCEGYTMAIQNLEAMAKHEALAAFREPDYGAEEPETSTN